MCSIEQQASGEVQPDYFGPRGLVQIVNWSQASYKWSRWLQMKDFLCRISRNIPDLGIKNTTHNWWGSKAPSLYCSQFTIQVLPRAFGETRVLERVTSQLCGHFPSLCTTERKRQILDLQKFVREQRIPTGCPQEGFRKMSTLQQLAPWVQWREWD